METFCLQCFLIYRRCRWNRKKTFTFEYMLVKFRNIKMATIGFMGIGETDVRK
jgi:hypothetical protein